MVGQGKAICFPFLGGHIAHVELERPCAGQCARQIAHQQVGQNAGVEAPRPNHNQIGLQNGADGFRVSAGLLGFQPHTLHTAVGFGDGRFAHHELALAVAHDFGHEDDGGEGGGNDTAANGQDPLRGQQTLFKATRQPR